MVFCMLQQPIRWAEWSFACCNNPFGGQNGLLHCCNNLFGGQNGLLHVATTHLEGLNGLLHCCNNLIRWAEWGFAWLQYNFVRVKPLLHR